MIFVHHEFFEQIYEEMKRHVDTNGIQRGMDGVDMVDLFKSVGHIGYVNEVVQDIVLGCAEGLSEMIDTGRSDVFAMWMESVIGLRLHEDGVFEFQSKGQLFREKILELTEKLC